MNLSSLRSALILLIALSLAAASSPACAAGGEESDTSEAGATTVDLTYTLYIGGISLGRITLNTRFQQDNYQAVSGLETSGVVNAFWRSKIEASANGVVRDGRIQPATYDAFSLNGANPTRREYTLTYGGPVPVLKANRNIDPMSDELKKDTLDPVSAMVSLVASHDSMSQKPCTQVAPVFDGRRRYNGTLSFVRSTTVKMDNGMYSGPVQHCRIKYTPLAGARQRILEGGLPDINVWMASFQSTANPGRHVVIPLRIFAETDLGLFVALATRATLDGQPIPKSQ